MVKSTLIPPPYIIFEGEKVGLDARRFLVDRKQWNKKIAVLLAAQDNLTLTPEHWEIIDFYRNYYDRCGLIPIMRVLCRVIEKELGAEKANNRHLYRLFPQGPIPQGARISGLPPPPSCI